LRLVLGPEVFAALGAEFAYETFFFKEGELVCFCWELFFNHYRSLVIVNWLVVGGFMDFTDLKVSAKMG
jgi:hypothetical protein